MAIRTYNPGFLTDDELAAAFCVRTSEFESIVETLQDNTGNSNQHLIVIGPRGSGKTNLLLRVALEVRRQAELADRLLPVVFSEESYVVSTCGEFWLECLARLAGQESEAPEERDLHATYRDLHAIQDEQTLAQRCLGAVLDVADRAGKRLVLVVENLNMLLGEMADAEAGWRLRKTLQTEPRIMLLGSATSRFAEIDDPDHALYDLFRIITLRPLDEQECATLWRAVSGASADRGKIRSLQILTGGSPRLMAIVARFGSKLSFDVLMSDILDLVDQHTEYFKHHIEDLSPQERRVFVALADLWKPATTREIAGRARTGTSQCSAQLQRLAARGAVAVHGGTPRRKQYYVVERMYNIYYLLRRGDPGRVVEALLRFMASFYSAPELSSIAGSWIVRTRLTEPHDEVFQVTTLNQFLDLPELADHREELEILASWAAVAADLVKGCERAFERDDYREAVRVCDRLLAPHNGRLPPRPFLGAVKLDKARALFRLDRCKESLRVYDDVVREFARLPPGSFHGLVETAMVGRARVLSLVGRYDDALAAFDDAGRRAERIPVVPLAEESSVAAVIGKGQTLEKLQRTAEAMDVYGEVVRRFGCSREPWIAEGVAIALNRKARLLSGQGRYEQALEVYRELAHRFRGDGAPQIEARVAAALVDQGVMLARLKRLPEALDAWDDVVKRYHSSDEQYVNAMVEAALVHKGLAYQASRIASIVLDTCARDLDLLLAILAERDELSPHAVDAVLGFAAHLDPVRALEMVLSSGVAHLLLPLVTALQQKLGLKPRVSREVQEVAQDVRHLLSNT